MPGQIKAALVLKEDYILRMQRTIPKRIVLCFDVKYELEEAAMIETFFTLFGPKPADDFYSHLCAPNLSSKMHIVLDLHCKTVPTVDLHAIEHEVFKVKKGDELYVVCLSKKSWLTNKLVTSRNSITVLVSMLASAVMRLAGARTGTIQRNWTVFFWHSLGNLQADLCLEY